MKEKDRMKEYLKSEIVTGIGMMIGGLIFLAVALLGGIDVIDLETKRIIIATFIGCLLLFVGIGLIVIFKRLANQSQSEEFKKVLQNNDERNQLINYMAANFSHRVTMWTIFAIVMILTIFEIEINPTTPLLIVLFTSVISYFTSLMYYNKNQ